jgi:hypothetical protein
MNRTVALFSLFAAACQPAQASTSQTDSAPSASAKSALNAGEVPVEDQKPADAIDEEQAALQQAFEAQAFDEAWRVPREGRLRSAVAELRDGTSLDSVECRQTLCKLVVRTSGGRGASLRRAITQAFNDKDGFLMEHSFVVYGGDDKSHATVYVSRNHYTLPDKNGSVAELPKKAREP